MGELSGKRILLIALSEYSDGIIKEMLAMGADVDYICDKPNNGAICKTLGRIKFKPYMKTIRDYYSKCIRERAHKQYDFILSIRGEYTPVESLDELKSTFPDAKIILYMWDSILNNHGIRKTWSHYDKVYTFDRIDYLAHKNEIDFLPLFYYDSFLPDTDGIYNYDIAFIGTGHDDRVQIIKGIQKQCEKYGLKMFSYVFLPHPLIYIRNKLTNSHYKNVKKKDIYFSLMPTTDAYMIDLICHGSPSPLILKKYLSEKNLDLDDVESISFRKKAFFSLYINRKKIVPNRVRDRYMILFLSGICYTENCYHCGYATLNRVSDITLGDSWGSELSLEEQKKGVSLIICQSDKGRKLIDMSNIHIEPVDPNKAIQSNHQLQSPSPLLPEREVFFKTFVKTESVSKAVKRCFPKICFKQNVKATLIKLKLLR